MTVERLDAGLLVGAVVLLLAVAAVRVSIGTGLPSLVLYVGLGMLLGEDVLGVQFDDPALAQVLGYGALVIILAEGGLTTSWRSVRGSVPVAVALATLGVAVSVAVVAVVAAPVLGLDARTALLLGAILSSTDAAAVFSVLRRVPLPHRVAGALEAESGLNDAPVVIIVAALSAAPLHRDDLWRLPALLVYELAVGLAMGLLAGFLGAWLVRRLALPAAGLYPLAVMALAVAGYGAAAVLHASGFLAVYVASLVLGNSGLPHRPATRGFVEGLGWLAQIGLFVMLGLLASPHQLPHVLLPSLVLAVALVFLARPLSVLASALPVRLPWRESAFLSWAGLRGGVPIVLATVPVVADVRGAGRLFDVVVVLVVVLTVAQAPTLPWAARRLGLADPLAAREVEVEASPLGRLGADLLEVRVPGGSRLQGVEVAELRLPVDASVTLVVRDGHAFVPGPASVLRAGDDLLVVTTASARAAAEDRLRSVSRGGRLAHWNARDSSG